MGGGAILLATALGGCKEDAIAPLPTAVATTTNAIASNSGNLTLATSDEDRETLARLLAQELGDNQNLRQFLHEHAMAMFDGDYDVLYRRVAEERIGDETLAEIFTRRYFDYRIEIGQPVSTAAAQEWVTTTINGIPDCQFSVPVECDTWDPGSYVPLAMAITQGLDEHFTGDVRTFDANGEVVMLPSDQDPTQPVVVIGSCERLDEEGNPPPAAAAANNTAARVAGDPEYLERYMIPDIGAIESWWMGGPELEMQVWNQWPVNFNMNPVQVTQPTHSGKTWKHEPDRKAVKDQKWVNQHKMMFYWYLTGATFLAPALQEIFVERDPGPNITLNLSVILPKGIILTLNPRIHANDEFLGNFLVDFRDPHWGSNPRPSPYGSGDLEFYHFSPR